MLRKLLAHPLTREMDIDDPQVTHLRQRIIQEKPFLQDIYVDWYRQMIAALPPGDASLLELGTGAGFLRRLLPGLITSDVFPCPGIDIVFDGHALPYGDGTLRGILMVNVLHHIGQPQQLLSEAARCLQHGGRMVMLEPWVTPWSHVIYTRLHHEPFDPAAVEWAFPASGPLSDANGALPWIVFQRDRTAFLQAFPAWHIITIRPLMPFRYLLSGGVSLRSLMPGWTTGAWRNLERMLEPWMEQWAMFALIVLERSQHQDQEDGQ